MNERIAIIGAGMNGVALALLLRLYGIKATLYEQSASPRVDGAGICVWPEGVQVLTLLLGKETVLSLGNTGDMFETLTAQGEILSKIALKDISPYGITPCGMFHRGNIYQRLLERLPAEQIQFNKKLTELEQKPSGTVINFADGSTVEADLVIGADGVFSKVRQLLFPEATIIDSGISCARGITNFTSTLNNDETAYVYAGKRSRIVTYTLDRASEQKYWLAANYEPKKPALDNPEVIVEQFSDYADELVNMINNTPADNVITSNLYELTPMQSWTKANTTLLGDACCAALPSLAIGFSLGLENAVVLAQCIASNCENAEQALQRYEMRCKERSNTLMNITAQLSELNYKTDMNSEQDAEKIATLYQEFFTTIKQSPL